MPPSTSACSKRTTGSFADHSSISDCGTYDWLSCSACPFMRNVFASISVTPSPARARSTARGGIALGHVLLDDVGRLRARDENRSHIANQRLDDVALLVVERVGRRDRFAFLPEGAIETADDFRLAKERDEALLQRACE